MKKIWSTVSSHQEFVCPYLSVQRDRIVCPDHVVRSYYVVKRDHFSVIIPRFPNGDLILVRQYRYPIKRYSWEFPMGVVAGQSMHKVAQLELKQETGYSAKQWTKLGKSYIAPGLTDQVAHVYLAEGLTQGVAEPEESEFITMKRLTQAAFRKQIKAGKINDGPTLLAWQLYQSAVTRA